MSRNLHNSTLRVIPLTVFLMLAMIIVPVQAREILVTWKPSIVPQDLSRRATLIGLRLYWGKSSGNYTSSRAIDKHDVNKYQTSFEIDDLTSGQTYYFAMKALYSSGDSDFSKEFSVRVPLPASDYDQDGDGLTDRQESEMYGTNPNLADSDGDGLTDKREVELWSNAWIDDIDRDGLINLLDPDADGDDTFDGDEVVQGTDPSDSDSFPQTRRLWVESEDGKLVSHMSIKTGPGASDSHYIVASKGKNLFGIARYSIDIPEDGLYAIWGRVRAKRQKNSLCFVTVNKGRRVEWDIPHSEVWGWDQVQERQAVEPIIVDLIAGTNTLELITFEDGPDIDRLLLTTDLDFTPGDR